MYKYKIKNLFTLFKSLTGLYFLNYYLYFLFLDLYERKKIIKFKKKFLNINKKNKLLFTKDWFSKHIFFINFILKKSFSIKPKKILEIGSYEGMSAVFFLRTFIKARVDIVDPFTGSKEQVGVKNFNNLKSIFKKNTKKYYKRIKIYNMKSKNFYSQNPKNKYDLIYIDGFHHYDTVLLDIKNSFKLLNVGGILILDDYFWKFYPAGKNPIEAINLFFSRNKKKIKILGLSSQIFFKKLKN